MKISDLIRLWRQDKRSALISAYEKNPNLFTNAPKGPHPMRPLYREILMEHTALGNMWDSGIKETSPFLKLDTWYIEQRYCYTPAPITKYIFTVMFKKIIPWSDRIVLLDDRRVLCKEQILIPDDIVYIKNDNIEISDKKLGVLLAEYHSRKRKIN